MAIDRKDPGTKPRRPAPPRQRNPKAPGKAGPKPFGKPTHARPFGKSADAGTSGKPEGTTPSRRPAGLHPEGKPARARPEGRRPFAKPAGERGEGKPAGARSFGKPAGGRPEGRPRQDKPFAGKPFSGKPYAGKRGGANTADPDKAAASAARTEGERIARRLARAGVASRREAETMIAAGRVSVNGRVLTSPAFNVGEHDVILIDGQPLPARERTRLFLFHKPAGTMTTTRDPEGRRTIYDVLPADLPRLITVGRLDYSTEGLLLLTNDGGLARLLELPATGWLRRYRVRVHGHVDQAALDRLKAGIAVDGVLYGAIEATLDRVQGSNAWLSVALREGKNREVRNVLGALGLDVTRLIRVSYGPFQLGELPESAVLEIRGRTLRDQLGPRLIEAAGADFESEIRQPLPNLPLKAEAGKTEGGERPKKRHADRATVREEALQRLDTRPDRVPAKKRPAGPPKRSDAAPARAGKPGSARPGAPAKEKDGALHSRAANVWRAPGARPLGPQKLETMKKKRAKDEGRTARGPGRPGGKPRGGHADRRR